MAHELFSKKFYFLKKDISGKVLLLVSLSGVLLFNDRTVEASSSDKILTQSVALIGKQVLTSREVRALTMLDAALNEQLPGKMNHSLADSGLETLLGKVSVEDVNAEIFDVILNQEAEAFAFNQLSSVELGQKLEKVKKALKSQENWTKLDMSESETSRLLRMKIIAKSYLSFKTTTMTSQISDSEALAYFEKNKVKFSGLPFEQMKANIKNFLTQQQLQDRLKSYFDAMKRKYKARNILSEQSVD